MYNNKGLVKHAEKALADKTRYMWGGIYRPITENYIQQLYKIYGKAQYPDSRITVLRSYIGKGYYGIDCVGLVKSYYWSGKSEGGKGSPNYGKVGFPDVNATAMFNAAKEKGTIDKLPEIPGLVLYSTKHPHVGVYIGGDYVIESTLSARGDGVTKARVSDWSGWTHWFKCPYIRYEGEAQNEGKPESKPEASAVKVGDKVKIKQTAAYYSGSKIKIPEVCKGKPYTVQRVSGERVLLKEIFSWVDKKDLEK